MKKAKEKAKVVIVLGPFKGLVGEVIKDYGTYAMLSIIEGYLNVTSEYYVPQSSQSLL
jgi:hypothetical protein